MLLKVQMRFNDGCLSKAMLVDKNNISSMKNIEVISDVFLDSMNFRYREGILKILGDTEPLFYKVQMTKTGDYAVNKIIRNRV